MQPLVVAGGAAVTTAILAYLLTRGRGGNGDDVDKINEVRSEIETLADELMLEHPDWTRDEALIEAAKVISDRAPDDILPDADESLSTLDLIGDDEKVSQEVQDLRARLDILATAIAANKLRAASAGVLTPDLEKKLKSLGGLIRTCKSDLEKAVAIGDLDEILRLIRMAPTIQSALALVQEKISQAL